MEDVVWYVRDVDVDWKYLASVLGFLLEVRREGGGNNGQWAHWYCLFLFLV